MNPEERQQSDELEKLARTPVVLRHEGKEYQVRPLRIGAMSKLRSCIKKRIAADLRENLALLGETISRDLKEELQRDAAAGLREPLSSSSMSDPEVVVQWLYISLKEEP